MRNIIFQSDRVRKSASPLDSRAGRAGARGRLFLNPGEIGYNPFDIAFLEDE
jgi:hypothetical protein